MIQELYFVPHSQSRAQNQMNTSVTLRYDTKTEKLQLVDVFGQVKNITIDTTPDMEPEDLSTLITSTFIQDLGFYTTEQVDQMIPKYNAGYGIKFDEPTSTFFISKGWLNARTSEYILSDEGTNDIHTVVNSSYIADLGFRLVSEDEDTLYTGASGISIEEIDGKQTVFLEPGFLSSTLTGLGFVPHDFDTYYFADEDLLTLSSVETEVESGTLIKPTFTINKGTLSGFISGLLTENGYISDAEDPIKITAGDGIGIQIDEVANTNVISLTAQIPRYSAGELISISDEYEIAFTGHIPTGLCDVWSDEQNIDNLSSLGVAFQAEQSDTLYYPGTGISASVDPNNSHNLFNINQQWLNTFVESYHYITGYVDTTYVGSDSITIDDTNNNSISINNGWFNETMAQVIPANLTTDASKIAIKSYINSSYIAELGFRTVEEDKDTTYSVVENGGLAMVGDNFKVDTTWLNNQTSAFIDNNINSTWLANTGIAITDTVSVRGIGLIIDYDPNDGPIHKHQVINVDVDWLNGEFSRYLFDQGITGRNELLAGSGIRIYTNEDHKDVISLTGTILSAGEGISIDNNVINLTRQVPTKLADFDANTTSTFIASLGFVLSDNDKDTKYGVVGQGGLTVDTDHNFAIDTTWMNTRLSNYCQKTELKNILTGLITTDAEFKQWLIDHLSS